MSLMSIALVLFLLGIFALLMLHAHKLSNYLKENIGFEIVMNSNVKEANILKLQSELDAMPAVKSTEYITKEEAIRRLSDDLGEDLLQWLGNEENPLVGLINQNVRRIGFALMVASVVLLIIAITLIRNTIRLSIYSKRFLVRSMQLVGATSAYIRRPFIRSGVTQGFFGALIADAMLALLLYGLMQRIPELTFVQDYKLIIGIFVGIILLGILLGGLSTRLALRKYLHADIDRLYA